MFSGIWLLASGFWHLASGICFLAYVFWHLASDGQRPFQARFTVFLKNAVENEAVHSRTKNRLTTLRVSNEAENGELQLQNK